MASIFEFGLELPPGFEDRTVYVYYLDGEGSGEAPAPAAPAAAPLNLRLQGSGSGGPSRFVPNVVVTRERNAGSLQEHVEAHKQSMLHPETRYAVTREGPRQVAGLPAYELELQANLEEPKLQLLQWHVLTQRDGYTYALYATTTPDRWQQDAPRFRAFVEGLR